MYQSKKSLHRCKLHPRLSAPARGQMITGVFVVEKFDQNFTGDLHLCTEDSMIIGTVFMNFSPRFVNLKPGFHFWGILCRGDSQLVRGLT